jgi:hypothetical protein
MIRVGIDDDKVHRPMSALLTALLTALLNRMRETTL